MHACCWHIVWLLRVDRDNIGQILLGMCKLSHTMFTLQTLQSKSVLLCSQQHSHVALRVLLLLLHISKGVFLTAGVLWDGLKLGTVR